MKEAIRKVISFDFGRPRRLPPAARPLPEGEAPEAMGVALVATADRASHQWAPRWLEHAGLNARVTASADEMLGLAAASRAVLMIVDASMKGPDGEPVITALRKHNGDQVPIIALCMTDGDVSTATAAGATDVVRRPFDWQVIAHRSRVAVEAHETLAKLNFASVELQRMHDSVCEVHRERRNAEKTDSVTGLPNGDRFRNLLHRAVGASQSSGDDIGVAVVGIDRFRTVNDAVGFDHANNLMAQFAEHLRSCLLDRHIVGTSRGGISAAAAHLGGARFGVMIAGASVRTMKLLYAELRKKMEVPFEVDGQSVYLDASLGAAVFPSDGSCADTLLHNAETAMLDAQEHSIGFQLYSQSSQASSVRLLNLDAMLREAIRNDDLRIAYQPITNVSSGEVAGVEALLRWDHAEEGAISPADFVPVAERNGLMSLIGEFVIEKACAQLRDWFDQGVPPMHMAVNISLCQLLRGDIVEVVREALERYDLEPHYLELELSERGVLNQHPEVIGMVRSLKAMGVRISIDDFGTGNAAIGYLVDLPVDTIKIDRSYVSGAATSDRNEAIASGMVALAERLNATVVAEGVETGEQLEMLRRWGSDLCQGFYFSAAMAPEEFVEWLGLMRPTPDVDLVRA